MRRHRPWLVVILLLLPSVALPQSNGAPARKQAVALRLAGDRVHLDGRLDDAAWRAARWITDFVQKEPDEGAAPTERTAVAFLYDGDALYVGARMYADDPARIQAPLARRDNGSQAEHIWISLDTYRDYRTAYSFGITASGVRMDWYHPGDHEYDIDPRFDPVWEGKALIDSLGWTAELRIPFSQLRFTGQDAQVWGLNIDRWVPSRREDIFWIPVPKDETGWSSRMGELHGIAGIRPSRRLEVLPYVATDATLTGTPDSGDPFDDGTNLGWRAGADVKMGLGPNLTLDATVNPDFGQVEADPAVVNLSAFEVFFDERRPFFTEGQQLFPSRFFYSRRVGARPRGDATGDYVDYPDASTILGAAKLTGRLRSGTTLGALAAVTAREYATTYDAATGQRRRTEVAPVTAFGVLRGIQEFGAGQSAVGATVTTVRRSFSDQAGLRDLYASDAVAGRLDWNLRFNGGMYVLDGDLGFTHVRGDSTAILALQASPVHYFQRPDADHVRLDSTRTSLSGYGASLSFSKRSGRHWLYAIDLGRESPGLEPNDAGRLSNADGQVAFGNLRYRETQPGRVFYNYTLAFETGGEWNFGGDRQFATTRWDAQATWRNYWTTNFTYWIDHPAQSQSLTRGGPSMGTPRSRVGSARIENSFGARTRWHARVYSGRDDLGGETTRLSGGFSARPTTRWQVSVSPNYLRVIDPRQYVATLDSGPPATFDARYLFATVDQSSFSLQLRANYTVTPDLTLEFYAEPFAASGRYSSFGHLAAPRTTDLVAYATDTTRAPSIARDSTGAYIVRDANGYRRDIGNPDFNVLSFRSNLVLRWEWRPGSTLFLVWQRNRGADDARGEHVGFGELWDAFRAPGDNFLAVKVSYWIPVR